MKVCVMGLGYVGLPLACLSSRKFDVIGFDIDEERISKIKSGICPLNDSYTNKLFAEADLVVSSEPSVISGVDIVIVCVPTPIDEKHLPDLGPLKRAARLISENLRKGQLVIVESTIYPGTTEEVIMPILESSGLKLGDFGVAYCPERIDPGNERWVLKNIPRVLGSLTKDDANRAKAFYQSFINAEIMILDSIKSAEAVKILENTFRDVNIAFINEMAKSFDNLGINLIEVIRGATTKPFGFMPFYPGPGVGGHCIPVDPYYLIERAKVNNFDHQFLSLARKINLSMPDYVVKVFQGELNKIGKSLSGAKVGVLGCTYKKHIDDIRESPAVKVIDLLKKKGVELFVYDPYTTSFCNINCVDSLLKNSDYVLLLTDHNEFTSLEPCVFNSNEIKLVVDTRNCLDNEKIKELGVIYRGIGQK
jgi:UDP-N-acetyl-D-glucosamine dehydrogenase